MKPQIALISTGGTITSISHLGELDLFEYTSSGNRLNAEGMLQKFPQAHKANLFDLDMKFCDVESLAYVLNEVSTRYTK